MNGSASLNAEFDWLRLVPTVSMMTMSEGISRITRSPVEKACLGPACWSLPSHLGSSTVSRGTYFFTAASTSRAIRAYWMIAPAEPESDGSPRSRSSAFPSRYTIATPSVVAIATPTRNATDTGTAFSAVTKMIADMICGPAIIVMARGRICRLTRRRSYPAVGSRNRSPLPDLPLLRGHLRARDRYGRPRGRLGARRRRRRLQPRLHLPEGLRNQAAPRGSRPAYGPPGAPEWRARRGDSRRGLRGDPPPAVANSRRARPQRGRRLHRQPERPQPLRAPLRPRLAARPRDAEPLLGEHPRPDAQAGLGRAHVRDDALDSGAGRRSLRAPAAPGRQPARIEREPADGARHARPPATDPRARRQGREGRPSSQPYRRRGGRAPLHPPRYRRAAAG